MRIALIGLGKMGANMARRLSAGNIELVAYNRSPEKTQELSEEISLQPAYSYEEVVTYLDKPHIIWSMVPAGKTTKEVAKAFYDLLGEDDIFIDGGNSFYRDSMQLAEMFSAKKIHFLDVGVSGGIWGLEEGYSLMIGGERKVADYLSPVFEVLAPGKDKGWGYVGPHGAGHFVKMVHNGIEYGMMEAMAEGFEILHAKQEFDLNLEEVSRIWQDGSVVRSWLLDLTHDALEEDRELSTIESWVDDSGEGRWTAHEAIELGVPTPVITNALFRRFDSRQKDSFAMKILAAMRNKFGGHAIKEKKGK
ncbi:MAG TPA: decarboxylating 6-phosphogluconate dehydrogenase [Anaerolineaceae bacterium]|nr:decarboxylating 6-phosphogluconate dehydrogenase [Anaerolineaceae bacterium]